MLPAVPSVVMLQGLEVFNLILKLALLSAPSPTTILSTLRIPPAHIFPLIPIPPLTTSDPELVEDDSVVIVCCIIFPVTVNSALAVIRPDAVIAASLDNPTTFSVPPSVVPPPTVSGPPVTFSDPITVVFESVDAPTTFNVPPSEVAKAPTLNWFDSVVTPVTFNVPPSDVA